MSAWATHLAFSVFVCNSFTNTMSFPSYYGCGVAPKQLTSTGSAAVSTTVTAATGAPWTQPLLTVPFTITLSCDSVLSLTFAGDQTFTGTGSITPALSIGIVNVATSVALTSAPVVKATLSGTGAPNVPISVVNNVALSRGTYSITLTLSGAAAFPSSSSVLTEGTLSYVASKTYA